MSKKIILLVSTFIVISGCSADKGEKAKDEPQKIVIDKTEFTVEKADEIPLKEVIESGAKVTEELVNSGSDVQVAPEAVSSVADTDEVLVIEEVAAQVKEEVRPTEFDLDDLLPPKRIINDVNALKVSITNSENLIDDTRIVFAAFLNSETNEYKILGNGVILGSEIPTNSFLIPFSLFQQQEELLKNGEWDLVISTTHIKNIGPFWNRDYSNSHYYPLDGWAEPIRNEEKVYTVLSGDSLRNCAIASSCKSLEVTESFTTKGSKTYPGIELSTQILNEDLEASRLQFCWESGNTDACFKYIGAL